MTVDKSVSGAATTRRLAGDRLTFVDRFSRSGLVLGMLFFASALTPTLVPRDWLAQGVLAGLCFLIGYGLGVFLAGTWIYLELPKPRRLPRPLAIAPAALCLGVAVFFLWQSADWQNSVRAAMQMPPVDSAHPFAVCAVALVTFAILMTIARLIKWLALALDRWMRRFIPRRVAIVVSFAVTAILVWSLVSNVLVRTVFQSLDSSYRQIDALFEPESARPRDSDKTGSPASLINWEDLGRMGRRFVASGPDKDDIAAFTGRTAMEPLRVYVGLRSGETAEERARLALEELKRQGGFNRSILLVITPTGTGWVDPSAINSLEYLRDGDIASVAVQYSYLSSPLSLLAQSEYGAETARALFSQIYAYWTNLPHDRRPKLYLHGLSLGAMNSEKSAQLLEMIGDPIQGALWSGPPFLTPNRRLLTRERNPGSLERLPEFRDGRLVRFMNQDGFPRPAERPWGAMRTVYLQYASDPIVFFSYGDLYRQPEWMREPTAHDVSPELRWYPIITALQLALDMAVAAETPIGFGHVYAPKDYIDAWIAVTDVQGWPADRIAALKRHLAPKPECGSDPCPGEEDGYEGRGG